MKSTDEVSVGLETLAESEGPFFTIAIPTPSDLDDARHRFEVEWKNALGSLSGGWDTAAVDEFVRALPHDGGAALVVAHARDGSTFVEFLDEPVRQAIVAEGAAPRLAAVFEGRQRARAHLVVETDRAGADIHAFDGGDVIGTDHVDGDTEHIHRGHPGGWSQRRFQQRAENTWERNADDVAEAIVAADERVHAETVFIAGDLRAQSLVLDALPRRVREHAVKVEAGSPSGIADEVVRLLADHVARETRDLAEQLRSRLGSGTATTNRGEVLAAVRAGRVEHLLVHDDGSDTVVTAADVADGDDALVGTRVVDAAIVAALGSDAAITVVPRLAVLDGPLAALLRW